MNSLFATNRKTCSKGLTPRVWDNIINLLLRHLFNHINKKTFEKSSIDHLKKQNSNTYFRDSTPLNLSTHL